MLGIMFAEYMYLPNNSSDINPQQSFAPHERSACLGPHFCAIKLSLFKI